MSFNLKGNNADEILHNMANILGKDFVKTAGDKEEDKKFMDEAEKKKDEKEMVPGKGSKADDKEMDKKEAAACKYLIEKLNKLASALDNHGFVRLADILDEASIKALGEK